MKTTYHFIVMTALVAAVSGCHHLVTTPARARDGTVALRGVCTHRNADGRCVMRADGWTTGRRFPAIVGAVADGEVAVRDSNTRRIAADAQAGATQSLATGYETCMRAADGDAFICGGAFVAAAATGNRVAGYPYGNGFTRTGRAIYTVYGASPYAMGYGRRGSAGGGDATGLREEVANLAEALEEHGRGDADDDEGGE